MIGGAMIFQLTPIIILILGNIVCLLETVALLINYEHYT